MLTGRERDESFGRPQRTRRWLRRLIESQRWVRSSKEGNENKVSEMGWFQSLKLAFFAVVLCPGSLLLAQEPQLAQSVLDRDQLTVSQWVTPAVPGELRVRVLLPLPGGEVRLLPDAEVVLIGSENTLLNGVTDGNGDVSIQGVRPGVYSLLAATPAFAGVFAVHVLANDCPGADLYPDKIEIPCGRIAFEMFASLVLPLLENEYSIDELVVHTDRVAQLVDHVLGNRQYRVRRQDSGMQGHIYAAADRGRALDADDLGDRLKPAERMKVFLFNSSGFVGRAVTNGQGEFRFDDVPTGIYTIITAGRDGVGLVGLELFDPEFEQDESNDDVASRVGGDSITVSYLLKVKDGSIGDAAFAMQVAPVDPALLSALFRGPGGPLDRLIAGGGGAGTGGAGLVGLGALAGGLIALSGVDESSDFPTPPPASPSQ